MTYKVARMGLMFFLALLIAVPFPLLAQNQTGKADKTSKTDGNDKDSKDKAKGKKKNSDVDNIGNRNINKGSINFISLDKEIQMGRQLAAEIERQVKLIEDPAINEYVSVLSESDSHSTVVSRLASSTITTRSTMPCAITSSQVRRKVFAAL